MCTDIAPTFWLMMPNNINLFLSQWGDKGATVPSSPWPTLLRRRHGAQWLRRQGANGNRSGQRRAWDGGRMAKAAEAVGAAPPAGNSAGKLWPRVWTSRLRNPGLMHVRGSRDARTNFAIAILPRSAVLHSNQRLSGPGGDKGNPSRLHGCASRAHVVVQGNVGCSASTRVDLRTVVGVIPVIAQIRQSVDLGPVRIARTRYALLSRV